MEALPDAIRVAAPAKVNLALHVVGVRADGRHLIESLVVFSEAGDRLSIRAADRDRFEVTGPHAGRVGPAGDNLVVRARDRLRQEFRGHDCGPVAILLEKNLPVAAGIGGGSSDAAAALRALSALWRLPVSGATLAATGLALGADLPMCLAGRPLVATGIGEGVAPLDAFPALPLLLVNPGTELATGAVFAALAGKANPALPPPPVAPSVRAMASWLEATRNDLEPPAMALAPEVGDVLEALRRAGAAMARMSGSGATCYGLFEDRKARDRAAGRIAAGHPDWFVMATTTGSSSPGRKDR